MLGECVEAKVVKPIGFTDEAGYTYPLNFALFRGKINFEHAFILGINHPVRKFNGMVIAVMIPQNCKNDKIWIIAPKNTRYINIDILKYIDIEKDFPKYKLKCLYESSCGAVVYRKPDNVTYFLIIKNKRSSHWGFPKGHLEMGETKKQAAMREVLEETGIHIKIHYGFEKISKYKIHHTVDKHVSIFVATTDDTETVIQENEIEDYIWLPFSKAMRHLKFQNDKKILIAANEFLKKNKYI